MRSLLLIALLSLSTAFADEPSLSIPRIAEDILKSQRYHFTRFTNDEPTTLRIVATTANGKKHTLLTLSEPIKEAVLAIQLGPDNELLTLAAYTSDTSNTTLRYSKGFLGLTDNSSSWPGNVKLGGILLELRGHDDSLILTVEK